MVGATEVTRAIDRRGDLSRRTGDVAAKVVEKVPCVLSLRRRSAGGGARADAKTTAWPAVGLLDCQEIARVRVMVSTLPAGGWPCVTVTIEWFEIDGPGVTVRSAGPR